MVGADPLRSSASTDSFGPGEETWALHKCLFRRLTASSHNNLHVLAAIISAYCTDEERLQHSIDGRGKYTV